MKSLKSYLATNIVYSRFYAISLLFFCCFSFTAQASPPAFSTAFSPATIGLGNESLLTYNIVNNDNVGVRDIAFTNSLPAGLTIANAKSSTTCASGTLIAPANGASIELSGALLTANSACTVSVYVTSSTIAIHTNITGDLVSDQGSSGTATSNLTVDANLVTYAMAFSPDAISQGEVSTLTIDIVNSNQQSPDQVRTSITLPTGLTVASPSNLASTCNDNTGTTTASGTDIILSSSLLFASSDCQITVDVGSSMAIGEFIVSSSISGLYDEYGSASASIDVSRAFAVMSFDPNPVTPNSTSSLNITLTNYDRSNSLTNISFSDNLDAALSGLVATGLPLLDVCGAGSSLTGTSIISLTGGTIAPESSCTINVPIAIPANAAQGAYNNTTSLFTFDGSNTVQMGAVSNVLHVTNSPQITMSFQEASYLSGTETFVDFTISNIDAVNDASNIEFTAAVDQFTGVGLGAVTTLPSANSCGVGSTFNASSPSGSDEVLTVSNANLVAGTSCSFTVGITLPQGMSAGTYQLATSSITSTINGVNIIGAQALDSIVVVSAPSLSFNIVEDYTAPSGTINAEFVLTHSLNATTDATAIGFTLDLDSVMSGLAYTNTEQNDICGTGSSFSGTSVLTFSGGTLAAGDSCTFSIELTLPVSALPGNYTFSSSVVAATVSNLTPISLAASDTLTLSGLTFTKEFLNGPFLAGDTVVARYTIKNSATADAASAMSFTDDLNSALPSLQATDLPTTPCGVSSQITGTTFLLFSGGNLDPGESCSFDVEMLIPVSASEGSYTSSTSDVSAIVNSINTSNENAVDILVVQTLTVNISSVNAPSTMVSPIAVNVDFSRDVVNFIVEDMLVTNGVASNLLGSGSSYTVDITPSSDGTVTIELPQGVVDDAIDTNVKNPAATPLFIQFSTPVASESPSLTISSPSLALTSSSSVSYQVSYANAAEVNLTSAAINLNKTGTANALVSVLNGTSDSPTVTLSNITGDGTLGFSINAGTARKGLNLAPEQGPSAIFSVDNTKPTVAISSSATSPSNSSFAIYFDFTDPATGNVDTGIVGFDSADILLTNATLSNFTGSAG
ncbi:MAG: beta strand repeat-containing protein, partial [Thalassotalea sp.]